MSAPVRPRSLSDGPPARDPPQTGQTERGDKRSGVSFYLLPLLLSLDAQPSPLTHNGTAVTFATKFTKNISPSTFRPHTTNNQFSSGEVGSSQSNPSTSPPSGPSVGGDTPRVDDTGLQTPHPTPPLPPVQPDPGLWSEPGDGETRRPTRLGPFRQVSPSPETHSNYEPPEYRGSRGRGGSGATKRRTPDTNDDRGDDVWA